MGKYIFTSALDKTTCDICGMLDGQVFNDKEKKIGVNYPPIHDGCRCTTIPYVNDAKLKEIPRRCRNPKTGKSEVITYTKYKDWIKKYR